MDLKNDAFQTGVWEHIRPYEICAEIMRLITINFFNSIDSTDFKQ